MHELDGDGALADGGGAAFDGIEADIAGDEDAGDGGLEEVGLAFELPCASVLWGGAGFEVGAGEFRPVRQQLRGGGGAAFEDRAEDGAEQSGDPARGIVAPWRFNRQILRL